MALLAQRAFNRFNERYFRDRLPKRKIIMRRRIPEVGIHGDGFCDDDRQLIVLRAGLTGDDLNRVLFHEMCHIGIPGHGKKFLRRLERVALRADQLGDHTIVESARQERELYAKPFGDGGPAPWHVELDCALESIAEGRPDLVARGMKSLSTVKQILKQQFGAPLPPLFLSRIASSWAKQIRRIGNLPVRPR